MSLRCGNLSLGFLRKLSFASASCRSAPLLDMAGRVMRDAPQPWACDCDTSFLGLPSFGWNSSANRSNLSALHQDKRHHANGVETVAKPPPQTKPRLRSTPELFVDWLRLVSASSWPSAARCQIAWLGRIKQQNVTRTLQPMVCDRMPKPGQRSMHNNLNAQMTGEIGGRNSQHSSLHQIS